jgi:hypothetical protein
MTEGEPQGLPIRLDDGALNTEFITTELGLNPALMEVPMQARINGRLHSGTIADYFELCPYAGNLIDIRQEEGADGVLGFFSGMKLMGARFGETGDFELTRESVIAEAVFEARGEVEEPATVTDDDVKKNYPIFQSPHTP